MMNVQAPAISETNIVLSNSRKDVLTAAMTGALSTMELTARATTWEPYTETPAQKLANARAARIAWLAESF